MNELIIGNKKIGAKHPAFIIAELSCNHLNNFDLAVETIHKMKIAGADCVKLQTSRPGSITLDSDKPDFVVKGNTLWDGRTLFDLYSETYTPWEWHAEIKQIVEGLGMIFFSSPFDIEAVDFLEMLDVPAYKIASFEITDIPLIKYAASKGKPIIMSTGVANVEDIEDAISACKDVGNDQIVLLKCTSSYPTPLDDVNLNVISTLRNQFNCQIGLSDHTLGSLVPLGAVALGATVIEKHFINDRKLGGPDALFSMEPTEFSEMVKLVRDLEKALGKTEIEMSLNAKKSRQFARSLYVVENIQKGDVFTKDNVRSIRPGHGMKPKFLPNVLGKTASQDIERGTALSESLIENYD